MTPQINQEILNSAIVFGMIYLAICVVVLVIVSILVVKIWRKANEIH